MEAGNVILVVADAALVVRIVMSAVRTSVVPRGDSDRLSRVAFLVVRKVFNAVARPSRPYEFRDRVMAYYGPVSLVLLPFWLLVLLTFGLTAMYIALGLPVGDAFVVSGSSLLTLGFLRPAVPGGDALAFSEAAVGLALVALLIS